MRTAFGTRQPASLLLLITLMVVSAAAQTRPAVTREAAERVSKDAAIRARAEAIGEPATSERAQTRFPLDLAKIRESSKVKTAEVVVKTRDGAVRPLGTDVRTVMVEPGDYVLSKGEGGATKVGAPANSGIAYQLPVSIATVAATGAPIALGIVVRTGNGLMLRSDRVRHEGRVFVGVVNTLSPATPITLTTPVQVTVVGPVESISPEQTNFESTNDFKPVTVVALSPRNPVELKVSVSGDITETAVPVPVFNGSLTVTTSVTSLAGFGFETADVTVQAEGIPNMQGTPVTLTLQGGSGSFSPGSQLALDANGRATATLRSSWLAPSVVVSALVGGGTTGQAPPIAYTWPVAWIVFAVVGGLIGAVLKQLTGTPRNWTAAILVSVLMGFLSAGLYTIGVSIIPAIPAGTGGQLVVALIAALGALGGVQLLPVPTGSK